MAGDSRETRKFNTRTLIHNWAEDRDMQRTLMKELVSRKITGTLKLDSFQQKMASLLEEVSMTTSSNDGNVHYGDVVQVVHIDTGNVLATDVCLQGGAHVFSATAAPDVRAPVVRNTFLLVKYHAPRTAPLEASNDNSNTVCYGQKLRLAAHPSATNQEPTAYGGACPLCLFSKPQSLDHYAKYSRQQLVGLCKGDTYDSVWQVLTPDPALRSLSEGVEVMAGAPVVFLHCGTQKALVIEAQKYPTDFGIELELSARPAINRGTKNGLEQASMGILKSFIPKGELSDAHWTFVTGDSVGTFATPTVDTSEADAALQGLLSELSPGGIAALTTKLVTLGNADFQLPYDELPLLLRQVGCSLADQAMYALAGHFKVVGKRNVMDAHGLIAAIRLGKC
ncbi:MAG: hypothetical protein WDW36_009305 [Sanguina aurantia]